MDLRTRIREAALRFADDLADILDTPQTKQTVTTTKPRSRAQTRPVPKEVSELDRKRAANALKQAGYG